MVFWSNYKPEVKVKHIIWAGVRGIACADRRGGCITNAHIDESDPWYIIYFTARTIKGRLRDNYILYDNNIYLQFDRWEMVARDIDLGLSMSHKRAFDEVVKKFVDKGMHCHREWITVG